MFTIRELSRLYLLSVYYANCRLNTFSSRHKTEISLYKMYKYFITIQRIKPSTMLSDNDITEHFMTEIILSIEVDKILCTYVIL